MRRIDMSRAGYPCLSVNQNIYLEKIMWNVGMLTCWCSICLPLWGQWRGSSPADCLKDRPGFRASPSTNPDAWTVTVFEQIDLQGVTVTVVIDINSDAVTVTVLMVADL